jgi:hypothetical protein
MPLESIYSENVKTMDTEFRSEDGAGSDEDPVDSGNPFEIAQKPKNLKSKLHIKSFPLTSKFHMNRMSFNLR